MKRSHGIGLALALAVVLLVGQPARAGIGDVYGYNAMQNYQDGWIDAYNGYLETKNTNAYNAAYYLSMAYEAAEKALNDDDPSLYDDAYWYGVYGEMCANQAWTETYNALLYDAASWANSANKYALIAYHDG